MKWVESIEEDRSVSIGFKTCLSSVQEPERLLLLVGENLSNKPYVTVRRGMTLLVSALILALRVNDPLQPRLSPGYLTGETS